MQIENGDNSYSKNKQNNQKGQGAQKRERCFQKPFFNEDMSVVLFFFLSIQKRLGVSEVHFLSDIASNCTMDLFYNFLFANLIILCFFYFSQLSMVVKSVFSFLLRNILFIPSFSDCFSFSFNSDSFFLTVIDSSGYEIPSLLLSSYFLSANSSFVNCLQFQDDGFLYLLSATWVVQFCIIAIIVHARTIKKISFNDFVNKH